MPCKSFDSLGNTRQLLATWDYPRLHFCIPLVDHAHGLCLGSTYSLCRPSSHPNQLPSIMNGPGYDVGQPSSPDHTYKGFLLCMLPAQPGQWESIGRGRWQRQINFLHEACQELINWLVYLTLEAMFKVTDISVFLSNRKNSPVVSNHLEQIKNLIIPFLHCKAGYPKNSKHIRTHQITALYTLSQNPNWECWLAFCADGNVQKHSYVMLKHEFCLHKSARVKYTLQIDYAWKMDLQQYCFIPFLFRTLAAFSLQVTHEASQTKMRNLSHMQRTEDRRPPREKP